MLLILEEFIRSHKARNTTLVINETKKIKQIGQDLDKIERSYFCLFHFIAKMN